MTSSLKSELLNEENAVSEYGSAEAVNGSNASLGLAFREIGNAFLVHVMSHSGDGKGSNYDLANVKTGFGINSSKCNEIPGLVVTPQERSGSPSTVKPDGATAIL